MKNVLKVLRFISIVAIIGFSMVSCEDDAAKDELNGTKWKATSTVSGIEAANTIEFNSPKFTIKTSYFVGGTEQGGTTTGTYTISGSTVVLTMDNKNPATGEAITTKGTLSGNKLVISGVEYTKQ